MAGGMNVNEVAGLARRRHHFETKRDIIEYRPQARFLCYRAGVPMGGLIPRKCVYVKSVWFTLKIRSYILNNSDAPPL